MIFFFFSLFYRKIESVPFMSRGVISVSTPSRLLYLVQVRSSVLNIGRFITTRMDLNNIIIVIPWLSQILMKNQYLLLFIRLTNTFQMNWVAKTVLDLRPILIHFSFVYRCSFESVNGHSWGKCHFKASEGKF